MNFVDVAISREHRFSIGRETETGRCYIAIPVANRLVDYEEYFEISLDVLADYPRNISELIALAGKCRAHLCDHLLLVRPGADRGVG